MPDTKTCRHCTTDLPVSDFAKRSAARDGLEPHCRRCEKARKASTPADSREPGTLAAKVAVPTFAPVPKPAAKRDYKAERERAAANKRNREFAATETI